MDVTQARLTNWQMWRIWGWLSKKDKLKLLLLLWAKSEPKTFERAKRKIEKLLKENPRAKPREIAMFVKQKIHIHYRYYPVLRYLAQRIKFCDPPIPKDLGDKEEMILSFVNNFLRYKPQTQKRFLKKLLLDYVGNRYYEVSKRMEAVFMKNFDKKPIEVAQDFMYIYKVPWDFFPLFIKLAQRAKKRIYLRLARASKKSEAGRADGGKFETGDIN